MSRNKNSGARLIASTERHIEEMKSWKIGGTQVVEMPHKIEQRSCLLDFNSMNLKYNVEGYGIIVRSVPERVDVLVMPAEHCDDAGYIVNDKAIGSKYSLSTPGAIGDIRRVYMHGGDLYWLYFKLYNEVDFAPYKKVGYKFMFMTWKDPFAQ